MAMTTSSSTNVNPPRPGCGARDRAVIPGKGRCIPTIYPTSPVRNNKPAPYQNWHDTGFRGRSYSHSLITRPTIWQRQKSRCNKNVSIDPDGVRTRGVHLIPSRTAADFSLLPAAARVYFRFRVVMYGSGVCADSGGDRRDDPAKLASGFGHGDQR